MFYARVQKITMLRLKFFACAHYDRCPKATALWKLTSPKAVPLPMQRFCQLNLRGYWCPLIFNPKRITFHVHVRKQPGGKIAFAG